MHRQDALTGQAPNDDAMTRPYFKIYAHTRDQLPPSSCSLSIMSVAVVQGGSGGLGLALTKHLLAHTSLKVYALTHRPAKDLTEKFDAPDRLTVLGDVDVREERGLEDAASTISAREGKDSVRLIACLAGIVRDSRGPR